MTPRPFITFVADQSLHPVGHRHVHSDGRRNRVARIPAARLDAAGIHWSVAIVWLVQVAYHAPLMIGAEYAEAGSLASSIAILAVGDLPISFIMARESYRARSLWPAVFFHSFHNTISQWLFPRFFAVDTEQPWLRGEAGVLPMATA
jgi:hypothetical protein